MELDGDYLRISFRCPLCKTLGVIETVMVNAAHFGLTGHCEGCEHSDTVWYAIHQIAYFTRGEIPELPRVNRGHADN